MNTRTDNAKHCDRLFLPNFCGLNTVFAVVVLSELFAIILTLSRNPGNLWSDLALTSLFMQWAGLSSAALLCLSRRMLCRRSNIEAGLLSYLLLLLVVLLLSEISYRLLPGIHADHLNYLLRNMAIGAIVTALALRYFYVHYQWRRRMEAESEARIQALQARIRPHFLFNSMNTIASLIRAQPQAAEEAVEDLADLFRASLRADQNMVPLEDELFLTRRYLHMEQLRLGDRLSLEWQIGGIDLLTPIPPLTLQPLVENAVYHGIEPLPGGGTITIRGEQNDGRLALHISNPVGPSSQHIHHPGNRMALDNIRQRLSARFAERATLHIEENDTTYTVSISLPLREETA